MTDLIISNSLTTKISDAISPLFSILFNVNKRSSVIIVLSIFAGNPSSARLLKRLIENDEISISEASYLLSFTSFANPIFIYNVFGLAFFSNYSVGFILLISHYASNLLIGVITRPKNKFDISSAQIQSINIVESITKNVQVILNIGGFIVFVNIIKMLVSDYLKNPDSLLFLIVNGSFEFVSGIQSVADADISLKAAVVVASFILGFGGIAIHLQVYSLIYEHLSYMRFLIARIAQGLISSIITFLIFNLIYTDAIQVSTKHYSYLLLIPFLILFIKKRSRI